jgi:hypothetical protein
LAILEANLLSNISNAQKINAVMVNGKYLPEADIMNMLDGQRKK